MFNTLFSFPILETERLHLNEITLDDLTDFHSLRSDENIMKFIQGRLAKTKEDSIAVIEKCMSWQNDGRNISWALRLKENNRFIGTIGFYRIQWENFRGEVGYILQPMYQGKGIMSEALQAVLEFGFQKFKFHTIEAVLDPMNEPSEKILIRNGFVKEAHHKENVFLDGKFCDSLVYTKFKAEL